MPDFEVLLEVFGYTLMTLGAAVLLGAVFLAERRPRRQDPVDVHAEAARALTAPTLPLAVGVPGSYDGPAPVIGRRVKGMRLQGHTTVVLTKDKQGVATWWVGRAPVAPRRRSAGDGEQR